MLLISGIPLVEVPGRIRDAVGRLGERRIPTDENGEYDDGSADYRTGGEVQLDPEADLSTTRLRRPSRRRQAADTEHAVDADGYPDVDPSAATRPLMTRPPVAPESPAVDGTRVGRTQNGPATGARPRPASGRRLDHGDHPAAAGPDRWKRIPAAARQRC